MSQPSVIITEIDGALGVLPASAGQLMAFVGSASDGPIDTPATFARVTDIKSVFTSGPLVEAAAYYINVTGRPCAVVRCQASNVVPLGTVEQTGAGTSVASATGDPDDDYDLVVKWTSSGTLGTAGPTYQLSYDGGRTYGLAMAIGTEMEIDFGVGVTFTFAAGTVVNGSLYSLRVKTAQWSGSDIYSALTALGDTAIAWEQLHLVGEMPDALTALGVDVRFRSFATKGKYRSWIASARVPDAGESAADYLSALSADFGALSTTHGAMCAGACRTVSGVSGRQYRRPVAYALTVAQAVSEEINVADVNLGALPGVAIRDANGNVDEHDESVNPGLDDARFTVLRTWDGYPGVYVNRPRLFSSPGSDFDIIPMRRVLNLADAILRNYFIRRLNRPIRVDPATGFILEVDALEIEGGATAALRAGLLAKPKASGVQFILSRTDNVLSTKTLHGTSRVLPLAYPEWIEIQNGFYNPALAFAA